MRYFAFITITVLIFLFCTVAPLSLQGAVHNGIVRITTPDSVYTLSSPWYFRADDNPEYAKIDLNHTEWNLLGIGSSWTDDPRYRQYRGNAWYRLELYLEVDSKSPEFYIPLHYRGAQLYLNGKLIGETRPFNDRGETPPIVGKPDIIPLPTHLLKHGRNILAVRTGSLNENGGFFRSPSIGPAQMLHRQWVQYVLWYSTLSAISIFLAVYFFLFFLGRRRDRYYLHFSGIALALGSWILGYKGLILWVLDFQWAFISFTYFGSLFVSVMVINFIHSFMGRRKNFIARAFEVFFLTLAAVLLVEYLLTGGIVLFQRYLYEPFIMANLLVVIYIFVFCIQGVRDRKPYAKRIFTSIVILALSYGASIFTFLGIAAFEPLIVEAFVIMIIMFASILSSRFAQVHSELEEAHDHLIQLNRTKDRAMNSLRIFRRIVSSSSDQMAFIDRDGIVLATNEALLKALKRTKNQLIGHSLKEAFGQEEYGSTLKGCGERCLSGDEIRYEKWYTYDGIGRRYMVVSMYPYQNSADEISGFVMNLRDITEQVSLEKAIVDVGENERRRIGMELHDGLSHNLLGIAIRSKVLADKLAKVSPEAAEDACEIEKAINRSIKMTHSLAQGVFPEFLGEGSLKTFFEKIQRDFESKFTIPFSLEVNDDIMIENIMVSTHLYYIVQEALHNAALHSHASQITVRMFSDNGYMTLIIEDDGVGFPQKEHKKSEGMGLEIMRFRARIIGGSFGIQRAQKGGTVVICRFPFCS